MSNFPIVSNNISSRIYTVRGVLVMLDEDLGGLYGVLTKRLNEQVKRNNDRFPDMFCFQLTKEEYINLKLQFATLNSKVELKYLSYVFIEQG